MIHRSSIRILADPVVMPAEEEEEAAY